MPELKTVTVNLKNKLNFVSTISRHGYGGHACETTMVVLFIVAIVLSI